MSAPAAPGPRNRWLDTAHLLLFAALALGLGALGGVIWWAVTDLPGYRVGDDGGAVTTERGLAAAIGGDASFVLVGLGVGLVLGVLGWRVFARLGWPVVALVVGTALAAALVCWDVGYHLGPGPLNPRLAAARPGDLVPLELTLRARAGLVAWPLFAVVPVLLAASLGRDPDDLDARPRPSRRAARAR